MVRRALILACVCLVVGCGAPIRVERINDATWFKRESRSALDSSEVSQWTHHFLRRAGLIERFGDDSDRILAELNRLLFGRKERIIAFHVAEFAYLEGNRRSSNQDESLPYYVTAAEYAYAYLFDPGLGPEATGYDPSFRWVCDLYNRSLAKIVRYRAERRIRLRDDNKLRGLFGEVELLQGERDLHWKPEEFNKMLLAYDLDVKGVEGASRSYGLGVPVIAVRTPKKIQDLTGAERFFVRNIQQTAGATILLRFQGSITDRREEPVVRQAVVELYDPFRVDHIRVAGRLVPLEADLTTPLAYMLRTAKLSGLKAMLNVEEWEGRSGLYMLQPYQEDKIPVVFVHGLMSSPLTWMQLFNDLLADRELRLRYQFWFFMYPTGNPIAYSAGVLRDSLHTVEAAFDPGGTNPAFQNMVLCGHSMGGLLSKMQVMSSGDRLWSIVSDVPLEELEVTVEQRELIRNSLFFERLPFVSRLVLMATPHRGSSLATGFFGRFGARRIRYASDVKETIAAVRRDLANTLKGTQLPIDESAFSGIGNLSPNNTLLREMATWKFPADLPVHSIIGNREEADTPGGSDGIVPYTSSHIDEVVSEKIVKSGHSVQRHPLAILEVRRILLLHLEKFDEREKDGIRAGPEL